MPPRHNNTKETPINVTRTDVCLLNIIGQVFGEIWCVGDLVA